MGLVRRFCLAGSPPTSTAASTSLTYATSPTGQLLADEKGDVGERYILAGRNFTLDRLFADLSRLAGVPPPPVKLPASLAVAGVEAAARLRLPVPISPDEVRSASIWWTYRNTKARKQLGFAPRPHEQTLEDAVNWQLAELGERRRRGPGPEQLALRAIGGAARAARRMVGA